MSKRLVITLWLLGLDMTCNDSVLHISFGQYIKIDDSLNTNNIFNIAIYCHMKG